MGELADLQDSEICRTGTPSRILAVLDAFAATRPTLGLSELATATELPKSTTHRLLGTLVASGYVRRVDSRYCLAEHAFAMGNALWACRPGGLKDRVIPFMIDLAHQTRDTVHLAILDSNSVLYIEKLFGHQSPPLPTSVGSRRPAHCTALGKALLAFPPKELTQFETGAGFHRYTPRTRVTVEGLRRDLTRVRNEGVAYESEEFRIGLTCVAAPIIDRRSGVAVAAISVSTTPARANVRRLTTQLLRATDSLYQQHTVGLGPYPLHAAQA